MKARRENTDLPQFGQAIRKDHIPPTSTHASPSARPTSEAVLLEASKPANSIGTKMEPASSATAIVSR